MLQLFGALVRTLLQDSLHPSLVFGAELRRGSSLLNTLTASLAHFLLFLVTALFHVSVHYITIVLRWVVSLFFVLEQERALLGHISRSLTLSPKNLWL